MRLRSSTLFIQMGEVAPTMFSSKKVSAQRNWAALRLVSSTSLIPEAASSPKIESTVTVNSSSYSA